MPDPQQPEVNPYAEMYKKLLATPAPQITTPPPPQPTTMQALGQGALNLGKGALKGALGTVTNIDEGMRTIPGIGEWLTTPMGGATADEAIQQHRQQAQPHGTMQGIGKGLEQAGEFLLPGGAEEEGARAAAKLLPYGEKALPAIKAGLSALSTGMVNKSQGGSFGTGAAMGAGGSILGEGAQAIAPKIAEKAIGITKADRGFGKNPGQAVLDETTGVRPSTIAEQAQSRIGELTPELTAEAHRSMRPASLIPARKAVAADIGKATQRNAGKIVTQMQPMEDFLARRFDTGQSIPSTVHPADLLDLRRGFNDEFGQWNPETLPGVAGTARKGYGALTDEFHRAVPEAVPLDQRISNLIPVARRAESTARNESLTPRILGRFGAHTGALTLGGLGGAQGYREGGVPGAIAGGLTGLIAPELIATPEGRMIAARTLVSPAGRTAGKLFQGGALQLNRGDQ